VNHSRCLLPDGCDHDAWIHAGVDQAVQCGKVNSTAGWRDGDEGQTSHRATGTSMVHCDVSRSGDWEMHYSSAHCAVVDDDLVIDTGFCRSNELELLAVNGVDGIEDGNLKNRSHAKSLSSM